MNSDFRCSHGKYTCYWTLKVYKFSHFLCRLHRSRKRSKCVLQSFRKGEKVRQTSYWIYLRESIGNVFPEGRLSFCHVNPYKGLCHCYFINNWWGLIWTRPYYFYGTVRNTFSPLGCNFIITLSYIFCNLKELKY